MVAQINISSVCLLLRQATAASSTTTSPTPPWLQQLEPPTSSRGKKSQVLKYRCPLSIHWPGRCRRRSCRHIKATHSIIIYMSHLKSSPRSAFKSCLSQIERGGNRKVKRSERYFAKNFAVVVLIVSVCVWRGS